MTLDLAARALQGQRPDEAERLAAAVLQAEPANLLANQILGTALMMLGRSAEAIEPLGRAAEQGEDPSVETFLGKALAQVGRRDEAFAPLRRAISRRPPYPQAFAELGEQLGDAGAYDEAIKVFEAGLVLRADAAVLRVGLGYIHLRRNDRAVARRLFTEARDAAPRRRDAIIALARLEALEGEHAAAANLYRLALHSQPNDPQRRIELAKCLLEMGDREAGEAMLREVARGHPRWVGPTVKALAATPHGRLFLHPSAAVKFLVG